MSGSTASPRDYYEVLGAARTASSDELKAAFRKAASLHHPDRNAGDPDAAERFKELNQAYQVLSDPQRRSVYDRFGHRGEETGSPFAAGSPFAGGVVDFSDIAASGILGDLLGVFGVGKGERGDLRREVEIDFTESAFGCEKEFAYERIDTCKSCQGGGGAPGSEVDTCSTCRGKGRVRIQQGLFPIAVERACPECRGRGRIVRVPCSDCRGNGLATRTHTLTVTLPPGVEPGATTLVRGAGNRARPDKAPGDLELLVRVKPHPFFRRVGNDVLCQVPVSFPQAALGAEVEVPTLDGKGSLKVPGGTQPGAVLRIRGKGIPNGRSRGDQRIEITVEVPTHLSARQRELVEELGKELGSASASQQRSFMDKLKEFFG